MSIQNVHTDDMRLYDDDQHIAEMGICPGDVDDCRSEDEAILHPAWHEELRRRIDEFESGKVTLLDADEMFRDLYQEFGVPR